MKMKQIPDRSSGIARRRRSRDPGGGRASTGAIPARGSTGWSIPRYVELLQIWCRVWIGSSRSIRAALALLRARFAICARARYEAALDLQGLIKSAVLTRAVGAQRTIGFPQAHLREPLAAIVLSRDARSRLTPHVIHKGLALVRSVGVTDLRVEFPLRVPETDAARAATSYAGPGGYAVINPGAAWPNKRWPPERFGALAASIRDRMGLTSVVLWGPGEAPLADAVVAASRGAAVRAPETMIVDIASIAEGARLMVSGDTGPLHIGGAVGVPIVALFGPTRVERNGPWADADVTLSQFAQCECHYERRCRHAYAVHQ